MTICLICPVWKEKHLIYIPGGTGGMTKVISWRGSLQLDGEREGGQPCCPWREEGGQPCCLWREEGDSRLSTKGRQKAISWRTCVSCDRVQASLVVPQTEGTQVYSYCTCHFTGETSHLHLTAKFQSYRTDFRWRVIWRYKLTAGQAATCTCLFDLSRFCGLCPCFFFLSPLVFIKPYILYWSIAN